MQSTKTQLLKAKYYIDHKRYAQARRVLLPIRKHKIARKWLRQLDKIAPPSRFKWRRFALFAILALIVAGGGAWYAIGKINRVFVEVELATYCRAVYRTDNVIAALGETYINDSCSRWSSNLAFAYEDELKQCQRLYSNEIDMHICLVQNDVIPPLVQQ